MNDLFGGGMGGMLGGLQQQMQAFQAEAEREEVEGSVANGLVTVRMNGAQEVLGVRIDPKVMDDREMLEDLLRAAINDASRRSKAVVADKVAGMMSAMGLPPGLF